MKVTSKDVEALGINAIECNTCGDVVALKGSLHGKKMRAKNIHHTIMSHKFSFITDKVIHWAELELDYAGG